MLLYKRMTYEALGAIFNICWKGQCRITIIIGVGPWEGVEGIYLPIIDQKGWSNLPS